MDQDEGGFFEAYVDACMHCGDGQEPDESRTEQESAKCLLCDRVFRQRKLFLNNVG